MPLRNALVSLGLALLAVVPASSQQVRVYVSSAVGDRIAAKPAARFAAPASTQAGPVFRIKG
jgi:hypothetical protein